MLPTCYTQVLNYYRRNYVAILNVQTLLLVYSDIKDTWYKNILKETLLTTLVQ